MTYQDMNEGEDELKPLFAEYREACGAPEPGPDFLPGIWRRIEERQTFWFSFEHLARLFAAFAVAACLLLLGLNLSSRRSNQPFVAGSYVDALAADQTAEGTYYAEGIRPQPVQQNRQP